MKTDKNKYQDPRWQKLRLQILDRDHWGCQSCGEEEKPLHVHHKYYVAGKPLWESPPESLITLCADCHEKEAEKLLKAMEHLTSAARKNFLSFDIEVIASGLDTLTLRHLPEVVASAYRWALTDPDIQLKLIDMYFKYLHKKHKKDGKNKIPKT